MALVEVEGLNVVYEPTRGQRIWSVRDVDLTLGQGEFVGLVGESGCGKSTLGFALTRMLRPPAHLAGGVICFDGNDISTLEGEPLRRQRLALQGGDVIAVEANDAPRKVRRWPQHPRQGEAECALSAPRLPHQADELALSQCQVDIAHRPDLLAAVGLVDDVDALGLQKCHHFSRRRGLDSASTPKLIRVNETASRAMASPGAKTRTHCPVSSAFCCWAK